LTVQEQIAKLESLLDRIRRKTAEPRPAASSGSPGTQRVEVSAAPSPLAIPTPAAGTPSIRMAEPAAAELEELDMMDEEIVEIDATVMAPPTHPDAMDMDLDTMGASAIDEPVPESAPRAAQALADEADLEPPVKTPPPESGRQEVAQGASSPVVTYREEAEEADLAGGGDVDALLEADLSGGPISKAPPGTPTVEQLGDTVELEGADAPAAEIELLVRAPKAEVPPDALEVALPRQEFAGGYDASLAPPSGAAADLEQRRRGEGLSSDALPPASLAEPMSAMPPTELAPIRPLVVERPPVDTLHAAEIIPVRAGKMPETFLELLDASLRL
jgi:hypothetical protein